MTAALWIIAVCEVVRLVQNALQLKAIADDRGARQNVYAEFINSMHDDNKEFVRKMLEEYEKADEQNN